MIRLAPAYPKSTAKAIASATGDEDPPLDERHGLLLVVQRGGEHDRRVPDGCRDLGVGLSVAAHGPAGLRVAADRAQGDRVVLELGRVALRRRVGERLDQDGRVARLREDDRARVRRLGDGLDELLLQVALGSETAARPSRSDSLQPLQLGRLQGRLVGRDHDQVDDGESARNHRQQGERELAANARERAHGSRKR